MTVQAVVDEQLGAVLQRRHVVDAVRRLVQRETAFGGKCGGTREHQGHGTNQLLDHG
jgi:hypothetical protein